MHECTHPLYIQVASSILIIAVLITALYLLCFIAYYAGYGWQASRNNKRRSSDDR